MAAQQAVDLRQGPADLIDRQDVELEAVGFAA